MRVRSLHFFSTTLSSSPPRLSLPRSNPSTTRRQPPLNLTCLSSVAVPSYSRESINALYSRIIIQTGIFRPPPPPIPPSFDVKQQRRKCIFALPTAGNPTTPLPHLQKKKKYQSILLGILRCLRLCSPPSAFTSRSTHTQTGHDFDINTQLPLKTH